MKTLLVDTSYLIFRSYFAYPNFRTHGKHTGALYGVIRTTMTLARDYKIDRLVFALDLPTPTWRHKEYTEYKAGRPPIDPEMREQIPLVLDWTRQVTPYVLSKEGYEADDMICSAIKGDGESEFFILSSDRDLYQLFTAPNIKFLKGTKGGYTEYGHDQFREEFGVEPEQYVDYKALVGDGSDNIKGVPGIGPKTAAKLLTSIGCIKNLYKTMNWEVPDYMHDCAQSEGLEAFLQNHKNLDLIQKIFDNKDSLELAYRLSQLHNVREVIGSEGFDFTKGRQVYADYEMKSIQKELHLTGDSNTKVTQADSDALF